MTPEFVVFDIAIDNYGCRNRVGQRMFLNWFDLKYFRGWECFVEDIWMWGTNEDLSLVAANGHILTSPHDHFDTPEVLQCDRRGQSLLFFIN